MKRKLIIFGKKQRKRLVECADKETIKHLIKEYKKVTREKELNMDNHVVVKTRKEMDEKSSRRKKKNEDSEENINKIFERVKYYNYFFFKVL